LQRIVMRPRNICRFVARSERIGMGPLFGNNEDQPMLFYAGEQWSGLACQMQFLWVEILKCDKIKQLGEEFRSVMIVFLGWGSGAQPMDG